MKNRISGLLLLAVAACTTSGQSGPVRLAFEVSSIKIHMGPLNKMVDLSSSGPRLSLVAYPVTFLMMEAFNLRRYQVSFGTGVSPDDDTLFDILAVAPGDRTPTRNEFRQMLQTLLADRFRLRAHWESKELPAYALVVDKNGPKFRESASDAPFTSAHGVSGRNHTLKTVRYTIPLLIKDLDDYFGVDSPVIDGTGLKGFYDINLNATPEYRLSRRPDVGEVSLSEVSVYTALQEQLGLKLAPRRAPIEVLIVDHVEKPSPN